MVDRNVFDTVSRQLHSNTSGYGRYPVQLSHVFANADHMYDTVRSADSSNDRGTRLFRARLGHLVNSIPQHQMFLKHPDIHNADYVHRTNEARLGGMCYNKQMAMTAEHENANKCGCGAVNKRLFNGQVLTKCTC